MNKQSLDRGRLYKTALLRGEAILIILFGNPITKKNSNQIVTNKKTGRSFIISSKQYKKYEKECGLYLSKVKNIGIDFPVNVKCLYYMQRRNKVDLTNLLEATDDILVKYGVLEDDNSRIVASHDGSRVLYDKNMPRAEIFISLADVSNE